MQKAKEELANRVYRKVIILYILVTFFYTILYTYIGITILLFNNALSFVALLIIYDDIYSTKYQKAISLIIQLSAIYNITSAVVVFGWGYGFELFLLAFIAIHYLFMAKNQYIKFATIFLQIAFYLTLYIMFKDAPKEYGGELFKNIIYIVNFSALVFGFLFLHNNLNIIGAINILNLEKEKDSYKDIAKYDFLTGLYTRLPMMNIINEILNNLKSNKTNSVCIVLCDLDNFKNINDTYGHAFGDKVLSMASASLKRSFSKYGTISRWGGEEFLAVLENQEIDRTKSIIQKARQNIESSKIDNIRVTATFGAVYLESPKAVLRLDEIIKNVDELLYIGKNSGKNRLVFKKI